MDLGNNIGNFRNKTTIITSVVTKIIIDIFMKEKAVDVSEYIRSISLLEDTILVKTGNPMINSELLLLSDQIEFHCKQALDDMGVKNQKLKIKYI